MSTAAQQPGSYRRSAGSPRGEARKRDLLARVADDLAANGLVDFSLRRAARAAATTHKVLLYYFADADDLLTQAVLQLRARRIDNAMAAAAATGDETFARRVLAVWPALVAEESRVLDQAIGLMLYDPQRYGRLGQGASQQYLPYLIELCPPQWSEQRKNEVAHLVLAAMRGFLIDRLASPDGSGLDAGFAALERVLEQEEKRPHRVSTTAVGRS